MADAYNLDPEIWENKIVGHGEEDPADLLASPWNFRIHSKLQQDAAAGLLDELGWVKSVIVNRITGHIIDGHARVTLAMRKDGQLVPVEYVELSEEEEKLALAGLDFIVGMAGIDSDNLSALLDGIEKPEDDAIAKMVRDLSLSGGLEAPFEIFEEAEEKAPGESSDGTLLTLLDISIDEPSKQVKHGETWELGPHLLLCLNIMDEWPGYIEHLKDGKLFVPYPGPFVPLSLRAELTPLVMVQPDTYIAALIIDKWEDVNGEGSAKLR